MKLFSTIGKIIDPSWLHQGEELITPLFDYAKGTMQKIASSLDYVPKIQSFLKTASPAKDSITCLIHAMGSYEAWGPNKKGDAFPLEWLAPEKTAAYGYKTFEKSANGYVHHRNQPHLAVGKVALAEFSQPMQRVELIVNFSRNKLAEAAPYFVEMFDKGQLPAVSMGCRVPFDICSVCHNKAANEGEYCDHIRNHRLEVMEDGNRVCMLNYQPVFHDISLVLKPADPSARVLMKVAEESAQEPKAKNNSHSSLILFKRGDIDTAIFYASAKRPMLSWPTIAKLASMPLYESLSTMTAMGVILRPNEYEALVHLREGKVKQAELAYENRRFCIPLIPDQANWQFDRKSVRSDYSLLKEAESRSVYVPRATAVLSAAKLNKTASLPEEEEEFADTYASYRKEAERALLAGDTLESVKNNSSIFSVVSRNYLGLHQPNLTEPESIFTLLVRNSDWL